jgi:hypothetical protein
VVSRAPLTIVVLLGMGVLALVLSGRGWIVPVSFFEPASVVVSVLYAALLLWDAWLWRMRLLHPWPVRRPDLEGTWRGEIKRPEGAPIPIYMVIDQTWDRITYRTFTEESRSASVTASLGEVDGQFLLAALYRNEPRLSLQERSRAHRGAAWLHVHGPPAGHLSGSYWTDRETWGEIRFERVSDRVASDYARAVALASQTVPRTGA